MVLVQGKLNTNDLCRPYKVLLPDMCYVYEGLQDKFTPIPIARQL